MDKMDIEVFLAIIKEKSILKASNLLYMSPSTVGTRLKMLEKELGVALIERKKGVKEISITPKGEQFLTIAENWMCLWNDCARLKNTDTKPYLSIATVDSLLEHGFVPLYRELVYGDPGFNLDIKLYPADMIYSLVSKKIVDVGFALYEMKYVDVAVEQIMTDEMVLVVPEHSEITGPYVHPATLDPKYELYVGLKNNLNIGWGPIYKMWHDKWFDISICPLVTATSISLLSYFLCQGNFWTIMPISIAMGFAKEYNVKVLHLDPAPPNRIIYKLTHVSPSTAAEKNIQLFNRHLDSYIDTMQFKL
ncbi:LysR family transcriptional regulator [Clostridium ganghwense]|uniref:LysR family transcriptional regulator n=1 Tax=Clostridium ganghwense TaxID=312089 RepID=A0ABT4CQZ0_9CLOT|nr:LysR family transcriptional regulator [Clostridium ganghwense]MCY6371475.1 LysR family transcriptional regulator [Clostridium ganghwense]